MWHSTRCRVISRNLPDGLPQTTTARVPIVFISHATITDERTANFCADIGSPSTLAVKWGRDPARSYQASVPHTRRESRNYTRQDSRWTVTAKDCHMLGILWRSIRKA